MPHKISPRDMIRCESIEFHPADSIEIGAIAQGLLALAGWHMSETHLKEQIQTCGDRWFGGCLLLATMAGKVLNRRIDWDSWHDAVGGVFTYEHVEIAPGTERDVGADNFTAYLFSAMTPEAWYQISENWMVPTDEALTKVIDTWAKEVGVPVKRAAEVANG